MDKPLSWIRKKLELVASTLSDRTGRTSPAPAGTPGERPAGGPSLAKATSTKRLGEILIEKGIVTQAQVSTALAEQRTRGKRIGEILVEKGFASETDVTQALAQQLNLPLWDPETRPADRKAAEVVPAYLAWRHRLLPVEVDRSALVLALTDPLDVLALDDVQVSSGYSINCLVAAPSVIEAALGEIYGPPPPVSEFTMLDVFSGIHAPESQAPETEGASDSPIVKLVDLILQSAIEAGASEVQIESYSTHLEVRFRRDGVLSVVMSPPAKAWLAIRSRLCSLAGLTATSHQSSHQGHLQVRTSRQGTLTFLLSTLPTAAGGRITVRLPDLRPMNAALGDLGLDPHQVELIESVLDRQTGLLLVVGPPHSGRTTTLYTMAHHLAGRGRLVATVEGSLELLLPGVTQVPCQPASSLAPAEAIERSLSPHPDVLVVDDVARPDVAALVLRAVDEGILVVGGVTARGVTVALERILESGVKPSTLARSLELVVHQQIGKVACTSCRVAFATGAPALEKLDLTVTDLSRLGLADEAENVALYRSTGCKVCDSVRYKGQKTFFELIPVTEGLRAALLEPPPFARLRAEVRAAGTPPLRDTILRCALEGTLDLDQAVKLLACW